MDSLGRRHTVHPDPEGPFRARLAMFGGSTMWGYTVRDGYTIPSQVARELQARGVRGVQVGNYAQAAYILAQNVASRTTLVRDGQTPDVALFLDGNNELAAVWRTGHVGSVYHARNLSTRYHHQHGFVPDLLRWGTGSALVRRIATALGSWPTTELDPPPADRVCPEIARQYARQTRLVSAMGEGLGFVPVFFWQPLLASSDKPLSEWEGRLRAPEGWVESQVACRAATITAMAALPDISFVDLSDTFDGDPETVFIDHYGHLTKAANAVVARRIVDVVEGALRRRIASGPEDGGGT